MEPVAKSPSQGKLQVCFNVHQFSPEEISVKTIGRQVVIRAHHEDRQDEHGYVSRTFVRKFPVPEGHEPNEVASTLSSDGILTIHAPREPIQLPDKNERIVPIQRVGPASVREHQVEHLPDPHSHHRRHHPHHINLHDPLRIFAERPLAIKYY